MLMVERLRMAPQLHWPIIALLLVVTFYIAANAVLNKNMSIADYLRLSYHKDSSYFPSVTLIGLVYAILLSLLLYPLLPMLPSWLHQNLYIGDYAPNKFGYTLGCILAYMFLKHLLCFGFYIFSGSSGRWANYCFAVHKYYLVFSAVLVLCILNQFFIHLEQYISIGFKPDYHRTYALMFVLMFVFKCIFEVFHKEPILPKQWYHKILYLCTLQILPLLVLAKILFM